MRVLVNARADFIRTEKTASRSLVVTAVHITHEEKTYLMKAKKEVLLTAG
jgi:hypothetical protein